MSIEAMKQALEALEKVKANADEWQERTGKEIKGWMQPVNDSITSLRQAIAEAEMMQAAAQGRAIKLAMAEANDKRLEAEKQEKQKLLPRCFADFQPNHEHDRKCEWCAIKTECQNGTTGVVKESLTTQQEPVAKNEIDYLRFYYTQQKCVTNSYANRLCKYFEAEEKASGVHNADSSDRAEDMIRTAVHNRLNELFQAGMKAARYGAKEGIPEISLYDTTSPPQRQPLTDEQIGAEVEKELTHYWNGEYIDTSGARDQLTAFARAIEAANGIKGEA